MKTPQDRTQRIRESIANAKAQIALSWNLRGISQDLCQENADLREFLREILLASWSQREHRAKE